MDVQILISALKLKNKIYGISLGFTVSLRERSRKYRKNEKTMNSPCSAMCTYRLPLKNNGVMSSHLCGSLDLH